jgi:hypothetical protein
VLPSGMKWHGRPINHKQDLARPAVFVCAIMFFQGLPSRWRLVTTQSQGIVCIMQHIALETMSLNQHSDICNVPFRACQGRKAITEES